MNLFRYIDEYGGYSFEELEFNELDNAIFSALSYLDLFHYVSGNHYHKKTIKEVAEEFFRDYVKKEQIYIVRQAIKMLRYIQDTKRYGELLLYNYIYKSGDMEQFSAVTIEINPRLVYVSFEGTDHLISGWREDFMMGYMFPVLSQKRAIHYVNRNFFFCRKKIILGGHSKGGNLALIGGMYANVWVQNRIIKIYNNDGPGLLKEQFESKQYQNIKEKLVHIIPNYSIVGILLMHGDDYKVVKSFRKSVWAHDLFTWVVSDKSFVESELSIFSNTLDNEMLQWLLKYNREERKQFVESLFDIFNRANVVSSVDIMRNKKLILQLIMESKELSLEDRKILKDFFKMLLNCFKDAKIEEIKLLFDKK